jgi:hypothetical protein
MEKMALSTAKSGLFNIKSEHQAITLMLLAQAENIHPIQAVLEYDIINGKPSLKATSILSRFQKSGGIIEWVETNDTKAVAKFSHPQGGSITIEWTIDRAKLAGVYATNPTWQKYPNQMLRARCIPEGVRAIYPACLSGMYSADEMIDINIPTAQIQVHSDFIEVEEIPKSTIAVEKKLLANKLQRLSFSMNDIKAFVKFFDIADDIEAIIQLNENETVLMNMIKEFEGESK